MWMSEISNAVHALVFVNVRMSEKKLYIGEEADETDGSDNDGENTFS